MNAEINERIKALAASIKHPGQREMFRSIWRYGNRSALRYAEFVCFDGEEDENLRIEAVELLLEITEAQKQRKLFTPSPFKKRIYKLISPEGNEVEISSIVNFCKQESINFNSFYKLIHGEYKQTKGWKMC